MYCMGALRKQASLHGCRWQEVPVHGPRCDMAGQGMSLVPMLDSPRMVSHTQARALAVLVATFHLQDGGMVCYTRDIG